MPAQTDIAADMTLGDIEAFRRPDHGARASETNPRVTERVAVSEAVRSYRVALVNMPFGRATAPSLHVGLLKAILRGAGFSADDYYPNLDLAAQLGFIVYRGLMGHSYTDLVGDWLASVAAFGEDASRADYFAAHPDQAVHIWEHSGKDIAYLQDVRERVVPEFVDGWRDQVDWGAYNAVIFVSTSNQIVASLALALRIKHKHSNVSVIFAGGPVADVMGVEYVRAFPYIDYALSGDAETLLPALLTRLAESCDPSGLLGLVARQGDEVLYVEPATPIRDLDSLPIPDYDNFYEAAGRYGLKKYAESLPDAIRCIEGGIPIEGSRGCWWGEKSHCTFCCLPEIDKKFRSKSPERLLAELDALSARYGVKDFYAIDLILDMRQLREVFQKLATRDEQYRFFWCIKSNLTRDHLRVLAAGGVKTVVAGVESFSTNVLKLMRKGVTKLQNVNVLRWCTYYSIQPGYHLLWGFPGETEADYAEDLETARLITHLLPPIACLRLMLERFSPDFDEPERFATKWRRPSKTYAYIYPPHVDLEALAFMFDYELCNEPPEQVHREVDDFIRKWNRDWAAGASLTYRRTGGDMVLEDRRFDVGVVKTYTLYGPDAEIYEAFSSAPRTPAQAFTVIASSCRDLEIDEEYIASTCDTLCEAGLMLGEAGKYLSLAIPTDPETQVYADLGSRLGELACA